MAGIKEYKTVQKVDGKSFVPMLLQTGTTATDRDLFWHYPNNWGNICAVSLLKDLFIRKISKQLRGLMRLTDKNYKIIWIYMNSKILLIKSLIDSLKIQLHELQIKYKDPIISQ